KRFEVTSANGDAQEVKPEFAIDSTAFGGIYGGKIKVIATQDGVGVRMRSDLISSADEIEFDVNGNILFEDMSVSGKKGVKIKAKENVENKGEIFGLDENSKVSIETGGAVENEGIISGAQETEIKAVGDINNKEGGKIFGDAIFLKGSYIKNEGEVSTYNNMQIEAEDGIENTGAGVIESETLSLKSEKINNSGIITSLLELSVTAVKDINNFGQINALNAKIESVTAKDINNYGQINAVNAKIETEGKINNSGQLKVSGLLEMLAKKGMENTGSAEANKLSILSESGAINNYAAMYGAQEIKFNGANGIFNYETGSIESDGAIEITSGDNLLNKGAIYAKGGIDILTTNAITNETNGKIEAGFINAQSAKGLINNKGLIYADYGQSLLKAKGAITNTGTVYAKESINFNSGSSITNAAGAVIEAENFGAAATAGFSNSGAMYAYANMAVNTGDSIVNEAAGTIQSWDMNFQANGGIRNLGKIVSDNEIRMIAQKAILNGNAPNSSALISAAALVSLKSAEKIMNYGYIQATGIKGEDGKIISGSGKVELETSSGINDDYKLNDVGVIDEETPKQETPAHILAKIADIENISDEDELYAILSEVRDEDSYYKVQKRIRALKVKDTTEKMKNDYLYYETFFKIGGEIEIESDGEIEYIENIDEDYVQNRLKEMFGTQYEASEWTLPERRPEEVILEQPDIDAIEAQVLQYRQDIMDDNAISDPSALTPQQLEEIENYRQEQTDIKKEEIVILQKEADETERLGRIQSKMEEEQERVEGIYNDFDWTNASEEAFKAKIEELLTQGYKGEENYEESQWQIEEFTNGAKAKGDIEKRIEQVRIDNKNAASVEKTGIHNYGRLYANGELELNSKSVVHNNAGALIYSKGDINFNVKEIIFNNAGGSQIGTGIYAGRDIKIGGDYEYASSRLGQLINYDGHIEAERNVTIKAQEVINYGSDDINIFKNPHDATDGGRRVETHAHVTEDGTVVAEWIYESTLTSKESQIQANTSTMYIDALSGILNYNSIIYGGQELYIATQKLVNSISEFEVTVTQYRKKRVVVQFWEFFKSLKRRHEEKNASNHYRTDILKSTNARAKLISGGTVIISANEIYNGVISDKIGNATDEKKWSIKEEYTTVEARQKPADAQSSLTKENSNREPTYIGKGAVISVMPAFELPTGQYGKYIPSTNPSFLYETDPLLRDITTFLGSQYFLNRLGLDPYTIEFKFLGDSAMEHEIIKRALEQQGYLENLHYSAQEVEEYIERLYETMDAEKASA
ncbi:MAG: hypothetical protein LBQ47_08370, partial [Endomicrobium sp.]|nr:hypothetical protein [Endomicrobium sp.]